VTNKFFDFDVPGRVAHSYRFRLGGAVDVGGRWLDGLPKQGVLVLKMTDGTTKKSIFWRSQKRQSGEDAPSL
jgi:hypothetical protein